MVQTINFTALDYTAEGRFEPARYCYHGASDRGWEISRNDMPYLSLGSGYLPLASKHCGICATDLNRQYLPFPLPQVTGHEVVAREGDRSVFVEINASHWHRHQVDSSCWYCRNGYANHCPQRLTLGIDRLPGGFSPWLLAPVGAIQEISDPWTDVGGVLMEPLAAAHRAVQVTPPKTNDRVAVLGCGRLGSLIVAALAAVRTQSDKDFSICALVRRDRHGSLLRQLGADNVVQAHSTGLAEYDIVYDATGSAAGFEQALRLARRCVHLKSTSGQVVQGMAHLTSLVVNEYQLLQQTSHQAQSWAEHPGQTENAEAAPVRSKVFACLRDIDRFLAGGAIPGEAGLRPGGMLVVTGAASDNSLMSQALQRGVQIHSSRCGDFAQTIDLFRRVPALVTVLQDRLITRQLPMDRLPEAFDLAKISGNMKIVVSH